MIADPLGSREMLPWAAVGEHQNIMTDIWVCLSRFSPSAAPVFGWWLAVCVLCGVMSLVRRSRRWSILNPYRYLEYKRGN